MTEETYVHLVIAGAASAMVVAILAWVWRGMFGLLKCVCKWICNRPAWMLSKFRAWQKRQRSERQREKSAYVDREKERKAQKDSTEAGQKIKEKLVSDDCSLSQGLGGAVVSMQKLSEAIRKVGASLGVPEQVPGDGIIDWRDGIWPHAKVTDAYGFSPKLIEWINLKTGEGEALEVGPDGKPCYDPESDDLARFRVSLKQPITIVFNWPDPVPDKQPELDRRVR